MKRIILIIILTLLTCFSVAAQKMVADVVIRDAEGYQIERYSRVTIVSYEETEDGEITSVHFTTRSRKDYILCGVNISLEGITYVDRPTVVYVRPVYSYRYSYWPAPRPKPQPRPGVRPGGVNHRPPQGVSRLNHPNTSNHSHIPNRGSNHPGGSNNHRR